MAETAPPRVAIERARTTDAAAIERLLGENGLPTAGLEAALAEAFVARDGERIVGSVALERYGDEALLRSLVVAAERRGSGLGERLVTTVLDWARLASIVDVYLLTETAAAFFPRFGFETIDRDRIGEGVRRSVEFRSACPAGATAMALRLSAR